MPDLGATSGDHSGEQLQHLIDQELQACRNLLSLLKEESEAIKTNSIEALERVIAEKQHPTDQLAASEQARHLILQQRSLADDLNGMQSLFDQLDPEQKLGLSHQWQELLNAADACREQNQINGIMVNQSQNIAERTLEILRGTNGGSKTYGPSGEVNGGDEGRPLAEA